MVNNKETLLEELAAYVGSSCWILMVCFLLLWLHDEQIPPETSAPAEAPAAPATNHLLCNGRNKHRENKSDGS